MFRDPTTGIGRHADTKGVALPPPKPGREVAIVERGDGRPAVAIVHDAQLSDDPELLAAAGAVALLAAENFELDAAWNDALQELRRSRARVVVAGDNERRKVERNLHDGVQQRLVAIRIHLGLAGELANGDAAIRAKLDAIGQSVEEAINELREVAHGLYPPMLTQCRLVAALEHLARSTSAPIAVRATGIGHHAPELESAVYYCCVEAVQNATKHGGPTVQISVMLREEANELRFDVTDDGPGFDSSEAHLGTGLQNMRDRLGARDGRLRIVTAAAQGTVISGSIPLHHDHD